MRYLPILAIALLAAALDAARACEAMLPPEPGDAAGYVMSESEEAQAAAGGDAAASRAGRC